MSGSPTRQSLVTSVAIKRPLTTGFRVLLIVVTLVAVAAAAVAWHSERQHRRVKSGVRTLDAQLDQEDARIKSLETALAALQDSQRTQQEAVDRVLASGPRLRQRWLVDRVADSVSLAEQTLVVNHQVVAARQMLLSADRLLAAQPMPELQPLRRALQQDIQRLGTLPQPDVDGIYLRLQDLDRRLRQLDLPRDVGQRGAPPPPAAEAPLGDTLASLWQAGVAKFRELIVIRHYDQPLQPLLDETRRQLLREQYSLLLDQAGLGLLRADGVLYRAALEALSLRIQKDLSALPHAALAPILDMLAVLQAEQVSLPLPASLSSREALDALLPGAGESL